MANQNKKRGKPLMTDAQKKQQSAAERLRKKKPSSAKKRAPKGGKDPVFGRKRFPGLA